jgi:hypothetical protein
VGEIVIACVKEKMDGKVNGEKKIRVTKFATDFKLNFPWAFVSNTYYQLWACGSRPSRIKNFLLHVIQTGSKTHPASYPVNTGRSLPGGKVPRT